MKQSPMKKPAYFILFALLFPISLNAQKKGSPIDEVVKQHEIEAHLSFLAADEMKGRNAGSNELDIAANYIRTFFKIHGLKPGPGTDNYFQRVEQVKNNPPSTAEA